jgi:hypothetical protein
MTKRQVPCIKQIASVDMARFPAPRTAEGVEHVKTDSGIVFSQFAEQEFRFDLGLWNEHTTQAPGPNWQSKHTHTLRVVPAT